MFNPHQVIILKTKFQSSTGIILLTLSLPAAADIIYSGLLDTAISTNFTGITVTVGDGTLNPFFGGVGVANNNFLQPGRIGTGNQDAIVNFGAGATINSGMTLDAALGYGGSSTHVGNGALQFAPSSEGYIGFKLDGVNYGWMRVVFTNNTGGAVVKDWAYDNSGAALVTGNVLQSAVSGGAQTVTLTSASGSFTLGTAITDAFGNAGGVVNSVVKQGAGTTVLSAASTYTGVTSINAGKLVMGDAVADTFATSAVNVAATATLGGSGTLSGNVTLATETFSGANDGGTLAPGSGTGTLTVGGATTLNQGSIFAWDISANGASFDKLQTATLVDGGAAGGSVFQIVVADSTFTDTFWDTAQSWTNIFTTDGTAGTAFTDWANIFGSTVSVVNGSFTPITPVDGSFTLTGSTLSWSAVPEPSSALAGLLLAAGLLRRRRSA